MATQLLAGEILDTLREAALVMSPDLCIERANKAFLTLFHKTRSQVEGHLLYEIGAEWDHPLLRHLLEERLAIAPEGILEDVEFEHDFQDGIGPRILFLNARWLAGKTPKKQHERIFLVIEDVTEKRHRERENARLQADARDAELRRTLLLKEVLSSATEGKLLLCLSEEELPPRVSSCSVPFSLTLPTLRDLRHSVRDAAMDLGISTERIDDFENAVGEAAMNAVVHAGGGVGIVCSGTLPVSGNQVPRIQVWISDYGKGIDVHNIPRAALEKGYTTRGTMGQGFKIVLHTADRVYLMTGTKGTTIVIEQEKEPPLPAWLLNLNEGGF